MFGGQGHLSWVVVEEQGSGKWWHLLTLGSRDVISLVPHKRILAHSKTSVVLTSEDSSENNGKFPPRETNSLICDLLQFLPVKNDKAHLHFSTFWWLLLLFVSFLPSLFLPLSLPFLLPLFLHFSSSPPFLSTKLYTMIDTSIGH